MGGMSLLPIDTKYKGPAPAHDGAMDDVVEECLMSYRINCFFKHFDIKSSADRTLVYGILFVGDCLSKMKSNMTQQEASKMLLSHAVSSFSVPGDAGYS